MATVASRDLRNHTADVLRRVREGEQITITVNGEEVAELRPVVRRRPQSMTAEEFLRILHQADPDLREDLRALGGTTDELGPIQ